MAAKTFPQFPLLPQEIQDAIWRAAMNTPTVHFVEVFAILSPQEGWSQILGSVRRAAGQQTQWPPRGPLQGAANMTPLVKLATPQVCASLCRSFGYKPNDSALSRVSRVARKAVSLGARMRAQNPDLPQLHADLVGEKPMVPLEMNPEGDLVYLWQYYVQPSVWQQIAIHRSTNQGDESLARVVDPGQTENIQHILLPYRPADWKRECPGCDKLKFHYQELCGLRFMREIRRKRRATRACRMCQQVQHHLQAEANSATEAAIRARLLEERKAALLPQVQDILASSNGDVGEALDRVSKYRVIHRPETFDPDYDNFEEDSVDDDEEEDDDEDRDHNVDWEAIEAERLADRVAEYGPIHEVRTDPRTGDQIIFVHDEEDGDGNKNDDDDAVSICSNDARDDFDWYNHSRSALLVDSAPFPVAGNEIAPEYLELPLPSTNTTTIQHPGTSSQTPSSTATATPTPTLPITPSQYRLRVPYWTWKRERNKKVDHHDRSLPPPDPHRPIPAASPRHGSHPDCARVRIENYMDENLPFLFPSAKSVFFFYKEVALRDGVTDLPSEGRRWYVVGGRGVYIEVVDPEDGRWVFPEGGEDERGEDVIGVVEVVRYLRGFYEKGLFRGEDGKWRERGERRDIEVGIVVYLELDGEGRVRAERKVNGNGLPVHVPVEGLS